jgi:hypothetical protein
MQSMGSRGRPDLDPTAQREFFRHLGGTWAARARYRRSQTQPCEIFSLRGERELLDSLRWIYLLHRIDKYGKMDENIGTPLDRTPELDFTSLLNIHPLAFA